MKPLIYADFQNADRLGRVRLNTAGTLADLARLGITLTNGLGVILYTDDEDAADGMRLDGVVERDVAEGGWVAVVDWAAITPTRAKEPVVGRA